MSATVRIFLPAIFCLCKAPHFIWRRNGRVLFFYILGVERPMMLLLKNGGKAKFWKGCRKAFIRMNQSFVPGKKRIRTEKFSPRRESGIMGIPPVFYRIRKIRRYLINYLRKRINGCWGMMPRRKKV